MEASLGAWHNLEQKRFSAQDFKDILQSALENANVHPNIAAPMLGHKVKGVDKHYSNHDLSEFVTENCKNVTKFSNGQQA